MHMHTGTHTHTLTITHTHTQSHTHTHKHYPTNTHTLHTLPFPGERERGDFFMTAICCGWGTGRRGQAGCVSCGVDAADWKASVL